MPKPIRDKRRSTHVNHRDETAREAFLRRLHGKFCAASHPNSCWVEECLKSKLPSELFKFYEKLYFRQRAVEFIQDDDPWLDEIDLTGEQRELGSSEKYPLFCRRNGVIELLSDIEPPSRKSDRPGWDREIPTGWITMQPEQRAQIAAQIMVESADDGLSAPGWTRAFNEQIAAEQRVMPITIQTAERDIRLAQEMGLVHIVKPAERHRRGQSWFWTKPVYAPGPTPPDKPDYSHRARQAAPPFERWMQECAAMWAETPRVPRTARRAAATPVRMRSSHARARAREATTEMTQRDDTTRN
jgi:hypothetical protein